MIEDKDIIYYIISSIGILVTGIFSFLVWKATVASNKVANSNYELSRSIIDNKNETNRRIKDEYIDLVISNTQKIKENLLIQQKGLNFLYIQNIPKKCGLTELQLAEFFDAYEAEIIKKCWNELEEYLFVHWKDNHGEFKSSFIGDEASKAKEGTKKVISKCNVILEYYNMEV